MHEDTHAEAHANNHIHTYIYIVAKAHIYKKRPIQCTVGDKKSHSTLLDVPAALLIPFCAWGGRDENHCIGGVSTFSRGELGGDGRGTLFLLGAL